MRAAAPSPVPCEGLQSRQAPAGWAHICWGAGGGGLAPDCGGQEWPCSMGTASFQDHREGLAQPTELFLLGEPHGPAEEARRGQGSLVA